MQVTHAELVDIDSQRMLWAIDHESEVIVFDEGKPVSGIYVGILTNSRQEPDSSLLHYAASWK